MTPIRWAIAVLAGVLLACVALIVLAVVADATRPKDSPERACNEAVEALTGDTFTVTERQQFVRNTVYISGTAAGQDLLCLTSKGTDDNWFATVSSR